MLDIVRGASWVLLPPAGLLWIAALGLLLWPRWPRAGRLLVAAAAVALVVLSMPITSYALRAAGQEAGEQVEAADLAGAAIVVLAGDIRRDAPEYGGPTVGPLTLERVRYAARLQRSTGLPILISGGPMQVDDPALATIMAEVLVRDLHVKPAWLETKSRNTAENAVFSAEILRSNNIARAVVVTHAWHMRRAAAAFRATGIPVVPAPTLPPVRPTGWDMVLPQTAALHGSFLGVHEILGYWFYHLSGRS